MKKNKLPGRIRNQSDPTRAMLLSFFGRELGKLTRFAKVYRMVRMVRATQRTMGPARVDRPLPRSPDDALRLAFLVYLNGRELRPQQQCWANENELEALEGLVRDYLLIFFLEAVEKGATEELIELASNLREEPCADAERLRLLSLKFFYPSGFPGTVRQLRDAFFAGKDIEVLRRMLKAHGLGFVQGRRGRSKELRPMTDKNEGYYRCKVGKVAVNGRCREKQTYQKERAAARARRAIG